MVFLCYCNNYNFWLSLLSLHLVNINKQKHLRGMFILSAI